jgi:hypothetical protein
VYLLVWLRLSAKKSFKRCSCLNIEHQISSRSLLVIASRLYCELYNKWKEISFKRVPSAATSEGTFKQHDSSRKSAFVDEVGNHKYVIYVLVQLTGAYVRFLCADAAIDCFYISILFVCIPYLHIQAEASEAVLLVWEISFSFSSSFFAFFHLVSAEAIGMWLIPVLNSWVHCCHHHHGRGNHNPYLRVSKRQILTVMNELSPVVTRSDEVATWSRNAHSFFSFPFFW